jgi:hypothetical protein
VRPITARPRRASPQSASCASTRCSVASTTAAKSEPRDVPGEFLFRVLTRLIYTSFAAAIREAVSNAYDAGAKSVRIAIDPRRQLATTRPEDVNITIADNGSGMSESDFWNGFASIGGTKDPNVVTSTTGRYPIGQFGIGAFSLTAFVGALVVYSKKEGQRPIKCKIDAKGLVGAPRSGVNVVSYKEHVLRFVECTTIDQEEWKAAAAQLPDQSDCGTIIKAAGVTAETLSQLKNGTAEYSKLDGFLPKREYLADGVRELIWVLQLALPLKYCKDPGGVADKFQKTALKSVNPPMQVNFSEVSLERNIFSTTGAQAYPYSYQSPKPKGSKEPQVQATGVVVIIPSGAIEPKQANGVLLRLHNVGVGSYYLPKAGGQPIVRGRLTGEVHLSGLHDELNAARDSFFGEKFTAFQKHLDEFIKTKLSEGFADDKNRKKQEAEEKRRRVEAEAAAAREEEAAARKKEAAAKKKSAAAKKKTAATATAATDGDGPKTGSKSGKKSAAKGASGKNGHAEGAGVDERYAELVSSALKCYSGIKERKVIYLLTESFDIKDIPVEVRIGILECMIRLRRAE